MRRIEFIRKVEKLGYEADSDTGSTYVTRPYSSYVIANVTNVEQYKMMTGGAEQIGEDLFNLCVELARTPINEREYPRSEGQKYLLKFKAFDFYRSSIYLAYDKIEDEYALGDNVENERYHVQFSQDEIDWIKDRYETDLDEFEQFEI